MVPTGDPAPVVIFTGRFGSGKTEIALNYSVQVADCGQRVLLIDLDLVTPYFRTREVATAVEQRGVDVVSPSALTRSVDVPAVVPEILGAIEQGEHPVVIDVGGDKQGARALGQYAGALLRRGYRMQFVDNPYRPMTATPEGLRQSIEDIQSGSRLCVTALISNPNLMGETTPNVIREGHARVEEAARTLDLPVAFLAICDEYMPDGFSTGTDLPVVRLQRYFRLPWEGWE